MSTYLCSQSVNQWLYCKYFKAPPLQGMDGNAWLCKTKKRTTVKE